MYLTRNQAWVQIHRGFESHPLRQLVKILTKAHSGSALPHLALLALLHYLGINSIHRYTQ